MVLQEAIEPVFRRLRGHGFVPQNLAIAQRHTNEMPSQLIDIPIPRAVRVSEAPSYGQTVMTYDPNSNGAEAYARIAREIALRGAPTRSNAEVG